MKTSARTSKTVSESSSRSSRQNSEKSSFSLSGNKPNEMFFGPSTLQPRLEIGQPDDPYEREADRVADQVMRMPDPGIQMKCEGCDEEVQMNPLVQRKSNTGGTQTVSPEISSAIRSKSGSGRPLPKRTQLEMSGKIGEDFSRVRIHDDDTAVQLSRDLGAKAFTVGNDVYFNRGQYRPDSGQGKKLLTHELVHTVQQTGQASAQRQPIVRNRVGGEKIQGGFFGKVWKGVKKAGKAVGGAIVSGAKKVGGVAGKVWDKASGFFRGAADWAWEGLKSLGSKTLNWLTKAGNHVWEAIKWFGDKAWAGIKWLGEFLWEKLALIGTNLWSFLSNIPVRLWRLIVHGWEGIKGIASWAWSGLKRAAAHIGKGVEGVFRWLASGIDGVLEWVLNGVISGFEWAVDFIKNPSMEKLMEGLTGALSWVWDGLKEFAKWGWKGVEGAVKWAWEGLKGFGSWIWEGIVAGGKWAGRLLMYVLDLIGFGEALQIIWGLIFRMRKLTKEETDASKEVHPEGMIPYSLIRVDENSLISKIGGAAVTTFHVLHYPKGGIPLDVVVHELTHVAQYEYAGSVYMPQAVHAQSKYGRSGGVGSGSAYDYERTGSLASQRAAGKTFKDLNRESQAELVQDFYNCKISNKSSYETACSDFMPFIKEMEKGEF
jgi:hypothetical protein